MMNRKEWNGRAVTFGDFDIKQGRAVREAFREDGEAGSYVALAYSMRYADTSEPVFQTVDDVWALPFRLQQRLIYLAGEALAANGMLPEPAEGEGKPNGHDAEAAAPSL
jgi:hypothetical protein